MILTFKLDSKDIAGIKKLISLCENLLSFETKSEITLEPQIVSAEPVTAIKNESNKSIVIKSDDVRAELVKVAKGKGKEVAKGLLNEFGVEKFTDVKEADYEKLLQRIREVLSDATC